MVSGSEVYQKIQGKIRELETEENSLNQEITENERNVGNLSQERDSLYIQLATLYLSGIDADSMKRSLAEARNNVERVYQRRDKRRDELQELISDSQSRMNKLQIQIQDFDSELNDNSKERQVVEGKVQKKLDADKPYIDLRLQANQNEKRLEQNKKRAETFAQEAESKLRDFESSKVFMYLVEKGYGTDQYSANKFIGFFDSAIAKKVNFRKNRQNYDFLKSMPKMIEEEVNRQQQSLDSLVEGLASIEEKAAKEYGLPSIIEEGKIVSKSRDEAITSSEQLNTTYKRHAEELDEIHEAKGKYQIEALGEVKKFIQSESVLSLKKRAHETPITEDDGIVEKMEYLDARAAEFRNALTSLKRKKTIASNKLGELRGVKDEFTRNDYESDRSRFSDGFDINDLLTGYIIGRYSSGDLTNTIKTSQHFKPRPAPTYSSGGYSSSRSSGGYSSSRSSGGFGGGGFSGGGGFGGGGMRSGGGF